MFGIGFQEIIVILVVALIIFGPKKLPELARLIGKGMAEFRRAVNDVQTAIEIEDLRNTSNGTPKINSSESSDAADKKEEHNSSSLSG